MWNPLGPKRITAYEGYLSLPGLTGAVPRFDRIRYGGFDLSGQPIQQEVGRFHAWVVQHECDHLESALYPMRMTDLTAFGFVEEVRRSLEDGE